MVFKKRNIDSTPKSLGEKFVALRKTRGLSIDAIERKTHIQKRYLVALESGAYDQLPAPLYTRNFVKAYAIALKADEDYFVDLYEEECGRCDLVDPMRMPRQKMRRIRLFVWNRLMKFGVLLAVLVIVVSYFVWQISSIIAPPGIELFSPNDELVTIDAITVVEGMVEKDSTVYVNGEQVIVNDDHTFKTHVDLSKGLNVIVVEAERRYSKRTYIERRVLYDPEGVAYGG